MTIFHPSSVGSHVQHAWVGVPTPPLSGYTKYGQFLLSTGLSFLNYKNAPPHQVAVPHLLNVVALLLYSLTTFFEAIWLRRKNIALMPNRPACYTVAPNKLTFPL